MPYKGSVGLLEKAEPIYRNSKKTAQTIRNAAMGLREPLYARPGHFQSPVPGAEDTERAATSARAVTHLPGVALAEQAQLALFSEIGPMLADVPRDGRYTVGPHDQWYPLADAAVYSALIRHSPPSRIVEVGSGYSSAVALDTADRWQLPTKFTFIEPYPQRLLGLLTDADRERVTLLRKKVEETELLAFAALGVGDILFIDSSHVGKAGSDVVWLLTRVLPILRAGVRVHFHDIFWPFEYPEKWLAERRGWNEDYFLHAFLLHNSAFQVRLFNDWVWKFHGDLVTRFLPDAAAARPGGLWLEKVA